MVAEFEVVKAQITRCAKVNFGNVKDATESFVGKKALMMTWLIYAMIVGTISKS